MVATTAAARRAARLRREEEEMTAYKGDDLDGWEFKIVRSNTGAFKRREFLEKVCREERQNGWEMIEKFDNNRIRFKRRIENRSRDSHAAIDPYRGTVGIGSGELAAAIVGAVIAALGIAIGVIIYSQPDETEPLVVPAIVTAIGLLALVMIAVRSRTHGS